MPKHQLEAVQTAHSLCPSSFGPRPTDGLLSSAGVSGWPHGTECQMEEHDNMDYFYQQVVQKDVTRRLQVSQDLIDYLNDPQRSPDVEQDKPRLDKTVDELTGWVNSSNFKVRDNGLSSYKGIALSLHHSTPRPFHELFFTSLGQGEDWKFRALPRDWYQC